MDIVTAIHAAAELSGIFLEIVQTTKHIIEEMKGARTALLDLFTSSERIRLNLELFRSLVNKLSNPVEQNIALSFNDAACRQTADEVLGLVRKVTASTGRGSDLWMRINWVFYRGDVAALVKKLETRERELGLVLTFIAAVVSEREVLELRTRAAERAQVSDAFSTLQDEGTLKKTHETAISPMGSDSQAEQGAALQTSIPDPKKPAQWLGMLVRDGLTPNYLTERDRLSEAAHWGRWNNVFKCLEKGEREFNEKWANACRLRESTNRDKLSLWTPLHKAAYMHAPQETITGLLQHGAFQARTIATARADDEFRYDDLTPAEIAHELGYDDIYEILAPVVKHILSPETMMRLQKQFHDLLRAELEVEDNDGVRRCAIPFDWIRLPPLAVLTELERPEMWFPLSLLRRGFLFRLDGRSLAVLSIGRRESQGPGRQVYRVTCGGWSAVEDVVVMGR